MIEEIIFEKLQEIDLVSGQNLFLGFMPSDISRGVMVRTPLNGITIDPYISGYFKGRIQIVTRHDNAVEGNDLAKAVQAHLETNSRQIFPAIENRLAMFVEFFKPETLPITFPRLVGNGMEWSQHFLCAFGSIRDT